MNDWGSGIIEIRLDDNSKAYRVVYIAKFEEKIYVLHSFQKKSQRTSQKDVNIIKVRYKEVIHERRTKMIDKIDTASRHITTAGDNIFTDLGFADDKATQLLAESNAEIEQALAMKKALMTSIANWIKSEGIRQVDAATLLHVSRPRVSDVVNQKTEKFTLDSLISMAGNIGKKVTLVIE
ncbi:hypothetical protein B4916_11765 [Yersinia intermedia]|nr:hypothetical protein B4916_11765 [Yersinia intermedia]